MKKRLLIILSLVVLLGVAIGIGATVSASAETADFLVGYAVMDITPRDANGKVRTDAALTGFGDTDSRKSTGGLLDEDKGSAYNLSATCVAMTDQNGNTLLMITMDLVASSDSICNPAKNRIQAELGIPVDHIMISATHTHSAPVISSLGTSYQNFLTDQIVNAAVAAYEDRTTIKTMEIGSVDAYANGDSLNGIRHYIAKNKTTNDFYGYSGDNFGTTSTKYTYEQITEIDDTMHLLQFTFADKEPIVLANWRAHPTAVSTYTENGEKIYYNYLSADYVASFRANMTGYRVAFFQGAAGNVNPRSREANAPYTKTTHYATYGEILATCAKTGLTKNMSVVPAGNIKTTQTQLEAETRWEEGKAAAETFTFPEGATVSVALITMYNRMKDGAAASNFQKYGVDITDGVTMLEQAVIIKEAYYGNYLGDDNKNDGSSGLESGYSKNAAGETVFNSGFHANNVVDIYDQYLSSTYAGTMVLNAITVGDHFSLVTVPGEMFDTRNYTYSADPTEAAQRHNLIVEDVFEQDDAKGNAVKRVFLMGYANGGKGYFPSYYANGGDTSDAVYAEHEGYGGYETNVTNYKFGTYELIQKNFIDMLTSLQKGCECGAAAQGMDGHTCFDASWQDWNSTNSLPTVSGYYTLTGDVTLTDAQTIEADDEIHLDLNGYVVTVKGASGYVINNEDALLTITDTGVGGKFLCTAATEGALTLQKGTVKLYAGALDGDNAGRPVNVTGGKLLVYGGVVTGGKTTNGGNLYVANGGQVTLYGGTISAGHANSGGNIYVAEGGKVTQQGGAVTGGYADQGTTNKYGGNLYIAAGGEYLLKDGSVADGNSSYQGGNVYIKNGGVMTIQNGLVTGGNATNAAGNIYAEGTLQMSGGTVTEGKVNGQTTSANANILLPGTAQFTMTGGTVTGGVECRFKPTVKLSGTAVILGYDNSGIMIGSWADSALVFDATGLTTGARIFVKFNSVSTTRVFATVSNAADAGYFISGHDGYSVTANADNGLVLTEGRYGCVCLGTAIGVGDHVCDTTTAWQDWTSADSLPTTTGKYRLTKAVTVTEAQVITAGQNVCLDLNGYGVSGMCNRIYELYTEGNAGDRYLSITNSAADTDPWMSIQGVTNSDQGGVVWAAHGDVSLFAGTLNGKPYINYSTSTQPQGGAAVYVDADRTFNMYGGLLIGGMPHRHDANANSGIGGAVAVVDDGANSVKSTFNMYGGEISARSAYQGGAVYVKNGEFNLYDGWIWGGTAQYGGLVYAENSTFNMYDGTVEDGYAFLNGGAVYLLNSQFYMQDGTISESASVNNGGNVYVEGGTFRMDDGEIAGGESRGYNGGNIYAKGTVQMTMYGGTIRDGIAYARASGTGSAGGVGGNLCIGSDAVFNLIDGTITGGKTDKLEDAPKYTNGGNIYLSGTLDMTGGEISGGYAGNCGGNIALYGNLYMSGGKLISGSCGASGTNIFSVSADDVLISGDAHIDGGFYIHSGSGQKITVSGSATVCPGETQSSSYGFRLPGYTYNSETGADDPTRYNGNSTVKADYITFKDLTDDAKITIYMAMGKLANTDRHFALLSGTNENILKSVSYYTDAANVEIDGSTLKLDFAKPVMVGDAGYATLQEAIDAYDFESGQEIKLMAELAEHITIDQPVKLDMNGYNLFGSITGATGNEVLYGMDSKNNSYDASACGKLMVDLKNVTVATQSRYVDPISSVVRHYVALDDLNGDYSFHRVYVKVSTAMLRPDNEYEGAISPGLYFKSTMAGDTAVVGRLSYYGVAAAKGSEPTTLEELKHSRFPAGIAFQPATAVVSNGTMVTGIMTYTGSYDKDPKQPLEQNLANAAVDVYGRPYMVLLDAEGNEMAPIFGDAYSMNLRQAVETADAKYSTLNASAKKALDKLYAAFPYEVSTWAVDPSRIPMPVVVEAVISLPCDTPVFQIDVDTDLFS